jgi:hypothetical protein
MYEIFGYLDGSRNVTKNATKAITRMRWSYPASFARPKNIGRALGYFCNRKPDRNDDFFHDIGQFRYGQCTWSDDDWQDFLDGLQRDHEEERSKPKSTCESNNHEFVNQRKSGDCGMCKTQTRSVIEFDPTMPFRLSYL